MSKAGVAQLVEQLTCNQQVGGPNPLAGSSKIKGLEHFAPNPFSLLAHLTDLSVDLDAR